MGCKGSQVRILSPRPIKTSTCSFRNSRILFRGTTGGPVIASRLAFAAPGGRMSTRETFSRWDAADHLKSEADIAAYLAACMEEAGDDSAALLGRQGVIFTPSIRLTCAATILHPASTLTHICVCRPSVGVSSDVNSVLTLAASAPNVAI